MYGVLSRAELRLTATRSLISQRRPLRREVWLSTVRQFGARDDSVALAASVGYCHDVPKIRPALSRMFYATPSLISGLFGGGAGAIFAGRFWAERIFTLARVCPFLRLDGRVGLRD